MKQAKKSVDCLMCVSSKDTGYLFGDSIISCLYKIPFIDTLHIVTPDPSLVELKLRQLGLSDKLLNKVNIISDKEILSKKELLMCGWSKQQIIKLRSYEISTSRYMLSVGADTIILKELSIKDFLDNEKYIINFRKHKSIDKHYKFEIERCRNICNLLGINSDDIKNLLRDYIFDVFLFDTAILRKLDNFLYKRFGKDYCLKIFPQYVQSYEDMKRIGEWTMYILFLVVILSKKYELKDGTKKVNQVHTHRDFATYDYKDNAVHFVRKDFDQKSISEKLKRYKLC